MADAVRLSYQSPLILPFRPSLHTPKLSLAPLKQQNPDSRRISTVPDAASFACNHRLRLSAFKVHATVTEKDDQPKWWERNAGSNMIDIHSTEEFLSALSQAGDKLVIVEFYGTWCGSCRALFPKLCKTAEDHPDILFLKVNFDENKPMCKGLNVKVLPYFHFYRGADGQLESFSCSLAKLRYRCGQAEKSSCETISVYTGDAYNVENKKFQKIKDAIETHNTARCSIGPPVGVGDINLGVSNPADKPAEASSR